MTFQNKKVLIVEDDRMLKDMLISELSAHFSTLSSEDGEEALLKIQMEYPDIILLDLLLPKTDGFQFLEQLRTSEDQRLAHIPVIVLSNLSDPQSIMQAQKYEIQGYFPKADTNLKNLITQIQRTLTEHPASHSS